MDFVQQQAKNVRKTYLLVALFMIMMVFLGFFIDVIFSIFPIVTLLMVTIATVQVLVGVGSGPSLVLKSVQAKPLSDDSFEEKQLSNIVEEVCVACGLSHIPKVYVIEDDSINAFATGFSPEKSAVCVTRGLLDELNREETEGVIAHEVSHVLNKDTLLMTMVSAILGTIVLVQIVAWRTLWGYGRFGRISKGKRGKDSSGYVFLALLMIAAVATLFALLGRITVFAVSRTREYFADAKASELTRNPKGLANALRKIARNEKMKVASIATAHLFIADPLKRKVNERHGKLANLFSTHPPIHMRIAILEGVDAETVYKELYEVKG